MIGTLHGAVRVFFCYLLPLCNWCLPEQNSGERSNFARASSLTRLSAAMLAAPAYLSVRAAAARALTNVFAWRKCP